MVIKPLIGPMLYAEINRTFSSEEELAEFLAANPTYELKLRYGTVGINVIIHDIRQAEYNFFGIDGRRQIIKWL